MIERSQEDQNIDPFKQPRFKNSFTFDLISISFFLLKLPILLIFLVFFMMYSLLLILLPRNRITNLITHLFSYGFYKIFYVLVGIFAVDVQPTPLRDTYRDVMPFIKPKPGDLIISNLGSFLNLFFLQGFYSPIFVIPVDAVTVLKKSFFSILFDLIYSRNLRLTGKRIRLDDLLLQAKSKYSSPVCIFPECAPTNGTCVLQFQSFGIGMHLDTNNISVIGFLHHSIGFCHDLVLGSNVGLYLIHVFGQMFGTLKVRTALPQDIPPISEDGIDEKWIKEVRRLMALIMRIPLSSCDYKQYLMHLPRKRAFGHRHND